MQLRLHETGALRIGHSIRQWLPEVRLAESITLSHLLRHANGLPDYGVMPEYHPAVRQHPSSPWTRDQFLEATLRQRMLFEPGAGWSYSNIGYMLLLLVIEAASGMTFRNLVHRYVAAPIGLEDTFVAESIHDWFTCVPCYTGLDRGL
jgi:D-alanyl-D-alanine carboxypeptidase